MTKTEERLEYIVDSILFNNKELLEGVTIGQIATAEAYGISEGVAQDLVYLGYMEREASEGVNKYYTSWKWQELLDKLASVNPTVNTGHGT